MAQNEHPRFIENIPAYAIGALDGADITALESHLKTCASCRAELAEYRAVSESLLTAVPPKQPSVALRKRLHCLGYLIGAVAPHADSQLSEVPLNLLRVTQIRLVRDQRVTELPADKR